jgi:hypothetical protein
MHIPRPVLRPGRPRRPIGQRIRRWPGGRGEGRLVRDAGADGLLEGVVEFEDDAFGAVVAVGFLFVLAADDGDGVVDVGDRLAGVGKLAWSRATSSGHS